MIAHPKPPKAELKTHSKSLKPKTMTDDLSDCWETLRATSTALLHYRDTRMAKKVSEGLFFKTNPKTKISTIFETRAVAKIEKIKRQEFVLRACI